MSWNDHALTPCPDWCAGCEPITLPDLVETVRCHQATLHTTRRDDGTPVAEVSLSRVDDLNSNIQGPTTVALRTTLDSPARTLDPQQARALSDALDYASRTAHAAHDATCETCGRPWPVAGLRDGRCTLCDRLAGRLRLVGAEAPAVMQYEPPTDESPERVARQTTVARFGNKATTVEVTHHGAAPDGAPATDLVRVRLGSDGYLTARGARKFAAYLLDAADTLDAVETT